MALSAAGSRRIGIMIMQQLPGRYPQGVGQPRQDVDADGSVPILAAAHSPVIKTSPLGQCELAQAGFGPETTNSLAHLSAVVLHQLGEMIVGRHWITDTARHRSMSLPIWAKFRIP